MPHIVRLDLRTWSGNHGMMRLAEKLGYQQEARFRQARIVEGRYYDGLGYGILRAEWETQHPKGFIPVQR
jgi:RimJ/RimL family protein N-acetyltransferase